MNNCLKICPSLQSNENSQQTSQENITLMQIKVAEVEKSIKLLKEINSDIRKCYEDSLLALGLEKKTLQCDLTDKMDNMWKYIKKTHAEIVELRDYEVVGETALENKMRRNMVSMCFRKFSNEVTTFQQFQVDYKARQIDAVKRDLQIKFPSLNKQEVESILENTFAV